jgi:cytoskeletal protein RodZ
MKLFSRRQKNNTTTVFPEEIQAYSQAEHREKMGVAALVGVISLLLTLVVLFGLFLGGKWLYRKLAGAKTQKNTTTIVDTKTSNEQTQGAEKNNSSSSDATVNSANNPTQQSEDTATQLPNTPTTPAVVPTPAPTNTATLPQTGPDLDL